MKREKILLSILLLVGLLAAMPIYAQTPAEPPSNFDEPDAGTERNPYLISNIANLRWLSTTPDIWYKGHHFRQTADIDATETTIWNFRPIGKDYFYVDYSFSGHYDGGNHYINNLHIFIDRDNDDDWAPTSLSMFGSIQRATLKNIRLLNIDYIGVNGVSASGLVSTAVDSILQNCVVTGDILTRSGAGLVGWAHNTTITNCYSSVNMQNNDVIYGFSGLVSFLTNNSILENSYFFGNIESITEPQRYGGLVEIARNSRIVNCYVSSNSAFNEGMAGLVGTMENSTIRNSFFDVEATGVVNLFNEIVGSNVMTNNFGLPTSEMKQASTYTEYGWNFTRIWDIDADINEGYPYLRNTPPPFVSDYDNPIKPLINSVVYPNPVRGVDVTIKWYAQHYKPIGDWHYEMGGAELIIYNIRGQLVKRSREFETRDGENVFVWDRRNDLGQEVASGVYFYQIKIHNETLTGRMVLLK